MGGGGSQGFVMLLVCLMGLLVVVIGNPEPFVCNDKTTVLPQEQVCDGYCDCPPSKDIPRGGEEESSCGDTDYEDDDECIPRPNEGADLKVVIPLSILGVVAVVAMLGLGIWKWKQNQVMT